MHNLNPNLNYLQSLSIMTQIADKAVFGGGVQLPPPLPWFGKYTPPGPSISKPPAPFKIQATALIAKTKATSQFIHDKDFNQKAVWEYL